MNLCSFWLKKSHCSSKLEMLIHQFSVSPFVKAFQHISAFWNAFQNHFKLMLLTEIESVEEIKSSEITWRNQNQLVMPTYKILFLILYLLFKNLFSTASTSCKRKTFSIFFWRIIFREKNLIFQNRNVRKVFTV